MTKAKKVLSLVLAVVMVAATFAFSASAANGNAATFTVSVDKATVSKGDVIKVTVNLTTDYYAGPTNVPVYYNPEFFEFDAGSVHGANIFGEGATDVQSYNDADTGCLRVAFIPQTSGGAASAKFMNGILFTFQLRAKADGTSEIGLHAVDQKTETNIGGPLYCGAYTSSAIDNNPATVGQTFTIHNATATVGATATPEIVAKDGTTGYVDNERKYVYGVTAGDVAANYFEATNGGTLTWDVGTASSENGTGATVTLKDSKGTDVATYTLVIFGDVNGDGAVDSADAVQVKRVSVLLATLDGAYAFAGDYNADGAVDSADAVAVKRVSVLLATPTANPYA